MIKQDVVYDKSNNPIRCIRKEGTAIVANYIHFLDATICHYIIENFKHRPLATVHDCFIISYSDKQLLLKLYRQGLVLCYKTHIRLLTIDLWRTIQNLEQRYDLTKQKQCLTKRLPCPTYKEAEEPSIDLSLFLLVQAQFLFSVWP